MLFTNFCVVLSIFCVVLCIVCFVTFSVFFVYICVLNYRHRVSYPIVSCRVIIYHIISYHIISYHIISYHIISYHISYHIISYIISHHIISYIICHIYHILYIIYYILYIIYYIFYIIYHIIYHNCSNFIKRLAQNLLCKLCTCSEIGSSRVLSTVFTCGENKTEAGRKQGHNISRTAVAAAAVCWNVLWVCAVRHGCSFAQHRNINWFVGMQQMFLSTFSAVIDYSVDIFCFVQTQFVSSQCGLKNTDTVPAKHCPLLGVTRAQGNAAYCRDCKVAWGFFVCLEEWLGSGVRVVVNSGNVRSAFCWAVALTVWGGDQAF